MRISNNYARSAASALLAAIAINVSSGAASANVVRGAAFGRPEAAVRAGSDNAKNIKYTFRTLDNTMDPTFNQLLGINDEGLICGYFGSGADGHPNKGYRLLPPYRQAQYRSENFPGSVQTQVVAINGRRDTAGFWVDGSGNNYGFVAWNGVFTSFKHPHSGSVNQLLGLNDAGIAAGFYVDGSGVNHGYTLDQANGHFVDVTPPSGTNLIASGINNNGDVTGFYTAPNGVTVGFLRSSGSFSAFAVPHAMATTPFGINNNGTIAGSYLDASGASHGFVLTSPLMHAHFQYLDDPNGVGSTVINGINDKNELVGFYVDAAQNTDGFLATP